MPEKWNSGMLIGFNTTKHIKIYLLDKGQELCVVNSLVWCDVQIQGGNSIGSGWIYWCFWGALFAPTLEPFVSIE